MDSLNFQQRLYDEILAKVEYYENEMNLAPEEIIAVFALAQHAYLSQFDNSFETD